MGHICAAGCTPSPPLGAERVGVRWGMLGASGETHLTFPPLRVGPLLRRAPDQEAPVCAR